jgi:hypothetical protein
VLCCAVLALLSAFSISQLASVSAAVRFKRYASRQILQRYCVLVGDRSDKKSQHNDIILLTNQGQREALPLQASLKGTKDLPSIADTRPIRDRVSFQKPTNHGIGAAI